MKRTNGWARTLQWRGGRPTSTTTASEIAARLRARGAGDRERARPTGDFSALLELDRQAGQTPRSTPLVALDVVHDEPGRKASPSTQRLAVGHDTRRSAGPTGASRQRIVDRGRASSATGTTRRSGNRRCRRRRRATRAPRRRALPGARQGGGTDEAEQRAERRGRPVRGGTARRRQPAQGEEFVLRRLSRAASSAPGRRSQAPRHKTQSNASSVRGGIFAASSRPGTAEYGRYVEPK